MANTFLLLLLLHCVLLTTAATSASPSPSPTVPDDATATAAAAALPADGTCCLQQVSNILDALLSSGDFGNWAPVLYAIDPSTLPVSATLFVPASGGEPTVALLPRDPPSLLYHVVPQRLASSQLKLFRAGSRLPTLLPNNSILVTGGSPSNFTLDGLPLVEPDLFSSDGLTVHGVAGVLNYTVYGSADGLPPPPPQRATGGAPTAATFSPVQGMAGRHMHRAACSTRRTAVAVTSVLGLVLLGFQDREGFLGLSLMGLG